jgi:hypothetical protein
MLPAGIGKTTKNFHLLKQNAVYMKQEWFRKRKCIPYPLYFQQAFWHNLYLLSASLFPWSTHQPNLWNSPAWWHRKL